MHERLTEQEQAMIIERRRERWGSWPQLIEQAARREAARDSASARPNSRSSRRSLPTRWFPRCRDDARMATNRTQAASYRHTERVLCTLSTAVQGIVPWPVDHVPTLEPTVP